MSTGLSIYEQMGGTHTEKNGLLYPNIFVSNTVEDIAVGKYGLLWIRFMKDTYPDRSRHLIRIGQIYSKVAEVNEEAYNLLDAITEKYLQRHKPINSASTMEMWKLREQVRCMAIALVSPVSITSPH